MKRERRTFTKQFKQETIKTIQDKHKTMNQVSREQNISLPLLKRWLNDEIASNRYLDYMGASSSPIERRKDYKQMQELKLRLAEIMFEIERI